MQEENSMLPTNYNAEYEPPPLKLIVVMGFQDSGKTTCLGGRTDPPPLRGLCSILSGGTDTAVTGDDCCREATCAINGKAVDVYFGLDGDSKGIIHKHISNIGNRTIPRPYDVAIITLQRKSVNRYLSVGTAWQKWIDESIQKYLKDNSPRIFPSHERYYVHTVIPQICTFANGYVGQIGTQMVKPPQRKWDLLTICLQAHILGFRKLFKT